MDNEKKIMKTDIFGITPQVGDIIAFNPPQYKGLAHGECVGVTSGGLPKVKGEHLNTGYMWFEYHKKGYYTIKTDFVICK